MDTEPILDFYFLARPCLEEDSVLNISTLFNFLSVFALICLYYTQRGINPESNSSGRWALQPFQPLSGSERVSK